jgi:hypothetical protein
MNQWHLFVNPHSGDSEKRILCPKHSFEHPFKNELSPVNDLYSMMDLCCERCSKNVGIWLHMEKFKKEAA